VIFINIILPVLGKILEKIILNKIRTFEEENNILHSQQFGFRQKHSTTHQILRIMESISLGFHQNCATGMVLLDIQKAFDSFWHNGILHKLYVLNLPIHLCKLIKSFLENRNFFVQLHNSKSKSYEIPAGVPQGSLLSPTLFNWFINDIPTPKNCKLALYADDTSLFSKTSSKNFSHLIKNLENGFSIYKN
jgi:hypothetical protein